MVRPQCRFTNGEQPLESSMVRIPLQSLYPASFPWIKWSEPLIQTLAGVIFPSLLQLHRGITDVEERKQKEVFAKKYRRKDETDKGKLSMADLEREEECGICMEISSKIVLPNCSHSLCMRCYRNWYATFHQPSPLNVKSAPCALSSLLCISLVCLVWKNDVVSRCWQSIWEFKIMAMANAG